jgi:7-carboxy-7-deazaguanine synthase
VQVETNGTLYNDSLPWGVRWFEVVVSPKAPRVHQGLRHKVVAYKYVLKAGEVDPNDGLPTNVLGTGQRPARTSLPNGCIYLQPQDEHDEEKNQANLRACLESCMRFGYRLGLQYHKIIGVE